MQFSYTTIKSEVRDVLLKEKGSKFLAFAFPVYDETEIRNLIAEIKKQYYDARHHCYAWQLGLDKSNFRANDDGEPSGTAGKPIYGQILSHQLTNVLIIVVRYFGGIKLGTGGLVAAYKTAAADAIAHSEIIDKTVQNYYQIFFNYEALNDVMRILKEEQPEVLNQLFDLRCCIEFRLRVARTAKVIEKLEAVTSVKCNFLKQE